MRLIDVNSFDEYTGEPQINEFIGSYIPWYAILSHTWSDDEVLFSDICNGTARQRKAFPKLLNTVLQAKARKLDWVWIDTCCIDKSSSAELQESINSMFKWYERSTVCFAYLRDVEGSPGSGHWMHDFCNSVWFTRGWTLQELLAPESIFFFSEQWEELFRIDRARGRWNSKPLQLQPGYKDLLQLVSQASGIGEEYVDGVKPVGAASIAIRMSWAAARHTTREEDEAYSLLGICEVNMPLLYGEGKTAFIRLQEEIMRRSDDMSIFYWHLAGSRGRSPNSDDAVVPWYTGLLAPAPEHFWISSTAQILGLKRRSLSAPFEMTNKGLRVEMPLVQIGGNVYLALLDCADRDSILPIRPADPFIGEMSYSVVGIILQRVFDGGNQFFRVYPKRFVYAKNLEGLRETIFVRQVLTQSVPNYKVNFSDKRLLLSSIRICGEQGSWKSWRLVGLWQRNRSCKWTRTMFENPVSERPGWGERHYMRSEELHRENGILTQLSIRETHQAVAIVLEHSDVSRTSAVIFQKANHCGQSSASDTGTRLYVRAFLFPHRQNKEALRDPTMTVEVFKYEASSNNTSRVDSGQDPASLSQMILLCYTLELKVDSQFKDRRTFDHTISTRRNFPLPKHGLFRSKIPPLKEKYAKDLFEKGFQKSTELATCIAPWSADILWDSVRVRAREWDSEK